MIKGISDIRRLPRLGKIRLGEKRTSKGGKEYPTETNHFVVPKEVARVYGEQPTSLDILLPVENLEVVFPQAMKLYGARGLICSGDRESATFYNAEISATQTRVCPCDKADEECKRLGSLKVILPSVSMGGIYQIDTRSFNSIVNINSVLAQDGYIKALCGRISFIPLKLMRISQEIQYEDEKGELRKSTHYPMTIVFEGTMEDVARYRQGMDLPFQSETYKIEGPGDVSRMALPSTVRDPDEEITNGVLQTIPTRVYTLETDNKGSQPPSDTSSTAKEPEKAPTDVPSGRKADPEADRKPALPTQITAITKMSSSLNMEPLAAISKAGITVSKVEDLTSVQASAVIKALNGKIAGNSKPGQQPQNSGPSFKPPKDCPKNPYRCQRVFYTGSGKEAKYHCGDIIGPMCPYGKQDAA
jgi:hypothetical protein